MSTHPNIRIEIDGPVTTILLSRPEKRNAVDGPMARALLAAFAAFRATRRSGSPYRGEHGAFCAGADLSAIGDPERRHELDPAGDGANNPSFEVNPVRGGDYLYVRVHCVDVDGYTSLVARAWTDKDFFANFKVEHVAICVRWGCALPVGGQCRST